MQNQPLRFALIGCGRIGRRHAEIISGIGKLISVCDSDISKADQFAETFDTAAFYSLEDLLSQGQIPDIAVVCTPNGWHADHSVALLRAGIHVLCEKPMAIKTVDCQRMLEAASTSKKKLFIVKQNRFNPPVMALKKAIDQGILGRILSVSLNCFWNRESPYYRDSWHGSMELDGGTLFTQFSHFVDLLPWMIGDIEEVRAFTGNYVHQSDMEFEDSGAVILKFSNGVMGSIQYNVNSYGRNMEGSITVFGERGTVKIGGEYLNKLEYQYVKDHRIEFPEVEMRPNDYGTYQGSMSNHENVYEDMLRSLESGTIPMAGGEDGMKTVQIIEKIYQSAERL
jgi:predicted dehydrogenase